VKKRTAPTPANGLDHPGGSRDAVRSQTIADLEKTGGSNSWETGAMTKQTSARYSPEVRARAVRMVLEHQSD